VVTGLKTIVEIVFGTVVSVKVVMGTNAPMAIKAIIMNPKEAVM
jgi:hypothetical protein